MNLSNAQIKELISSPKHRSEIEASVWHHKRLSFHSDIVLRQKYLSQYYNSFIAWVGEVLPEDKKIRFEQLLTFPICTNELTKDIYIGLERVWIAKDYCEKVNFISSEYETDFMDYLKKIKTQHLWRIEGWSAMKTAIDSVVVVSLPEEQTGERPDPYFFFLSPSNIIDLNINEKNEVEYVIWTSGESLYVWDSTYMRRFGYKNKKLSSDPVEREHGLGYCPARMFWSDKLQDGNYINKRSPITDSLGDLDWLLFFKTSKKYLELGSAYPIYISYEFASGENERTDAEGKYEARQDINKPKGSPGAGSYWTVPAPTMSGEVDLMENPVQVVSAEIDACKYSTEEVERLSTDIYRSCVGYDGEMIRSEAINEKQVEAAFKSREEVLMNVGRNFAAIMEWTNLTLARLRYEPSYVNGCIVSFGSQFYLETEDQLVEQIKQSRDGNMNPVITETLENKLLDTVFRNNRSGRQRAEIIQLIDPLPGISIDRAKEYIGQGIDEKDFNIKLNILRYVSIFEAENGNLSDFGKDLQMSERIKRIKQKINEYAGK